MSSNSAQLIIQYHIAAGEVDSNWLSLCNLISQPKREAQRDQEKRVQDIIALHRQKLQNVKAQEDAIKLSEPHWYTSKKIDVAILVIDFILGSVTLGVGIWDFKYQQDLPGNVQRTKALLGCLIAATVAMYVYTGIKGVRAWLKADIKKAISQRLEARRVAMRQQEKAFDLFCEYLQTNDPKLQTEKMHGIVHHLKQIPPEFGSAYQALDEFLSELIRLAHENEETKKLVDELVLIQKKRRSVEVTSSGKEEKDLKEKKPVDKLAASSKEHDDVKKLGGSHFLKIEKADKASAPLAKASFRLIENIENNIDEMREKEIFARLKSITGHHFKKIVAEGEEIINPLEEPSDHIAIDITPIYPQIHHQNTPVPVPLRGSIDVREFPTERNNNLTIDNPD